MIRGGLNRLSEDEKTLLDAERGGLTREERAALCARLALDPEQYDAVLDGLADTEAAAGYAPEVVTRVRAARAERFSFERSKGRWRRLL